MAFCGMGFLRRDLGSICERHDHTLSHRSKLLRLWREKTLVFSIKSLDRRTEHQAIPTASILREELCHVG